MSLNKYLQLAKPGIIFGNLITLTGGFLLATHRHIGFEYLGLYLCTMLGTAIMIGSGCVFNNLFDRDIDAQMIRTKNRPLVTQDIKISAAIIYGIILFLLGVLVLYYLVNALTAIIVIIGFIVYVVIYTISKRFTKHATVLGGVSGAIPPVAGYIAVTNNFDLNSLALFLILFFWQLPHSYAIAILYLKDYKKVNIPSLPIVKGVEYTKKVILVYMIFFLISSTLPSLLGTADIYSLVICLAMAIFWLFVSIKSLMINDDIHIFAKKVFKWSIIVVTVISLTIG